MEIEPSQSKQSYYKDYYQKNKDKMKMQISESKKERIANPPEHETEKKRSKLIEKLNDPQNPYKRIPLKLLRRYEVKYDHTAKLYS